MAEKKLGKASYVSLDGNEAAAYGSYAFTEVAGIYPITPSSNMAEHMDAWSSKGKKNLFNQRVKVMEMQSEAGAAGVVHGVLQGGSLAATYTASQGLLLMIPNIYKCVGELLPAVFHVSARAIAARSLSIFGDHQDIYAVRQTGIAMMASHSVQEVADLAPLAHLIAIKSSSPMLHFFDGFRTSHEIQKVSLLDYSELEKLMDKEAIKHFKDKALNPNHPVTRGGAENDDIYFQGKEAQNKHFENIVAITEEYMKKISDLTGRHYAPFTYVGDANATRVIVAMGSVTETIQEVIKDLNAKGEKVGLIKVHLYRPFSKDAFLRVLPKSVKKVAVLDRTKEIGSVAEPLCLDVQAVLAQGNIKMDVVVGGRYGLSSKDTQPKHIKAVYDFLNSNKPFTGFTVGITDDVTNLSLPIDDYQLKNDYTSCLFYGLGSDGTVSANKNSIKIIGDHTDLYSQAYFAYDSKKAGGVTRSHLRFGKNPIQSTYYIKNADFISCSLDSYLVKYDMIANLKKGGAFLLNTTFGLDELESRLPNRVKKQLAEKEAKFYIINATDEAVKIGMGRRTNTILQSAFFKLANIIPFDEALKYMKEAAKKAYGKKGAEIVALNYKAIDIGGDAIVEVKVKPEWKNLTVNNKLSLKGDDYFDEYTDIIAGLRGNDLPVSTFTQHGLLDGTMRNNISYQEKRNIATEVPQWIKENCIQCGKCSFVCPHATIRTFLLTDEEISKGPKDLANHLLPAMGPNVSHLKFTVSVSPDNCVGCGLCVVECPGMKGNNALKMVDVRDELKNVPVADYLYKHVEYKGQYFNQTTVKGASFLYPYFEVSGACGGCGETPYYRLVSQFFGKDMIIANATGCSSIYSGSTPSTPFCTDKNGQGPAWSNSLFEDNAEYGFGVRLAVDYKLNEIRKLIEANIGNTTGRLKEVLEFYLVNQRNREEVRKIVPELLNLVAASGNDSLKALSDFKDYLIDKSVWIIGGDGWAYDIGYGGLDHVLANDENVNILVLDTEVYSNTGGQSSKSSQTGSIAKFTAGGKKTAKKDLGAIAMMYGHAYVAQVSMGANPGQLLKAIKEAESYNGPSIIIAYSPCIEHGIKGGLANHQISQKRAVECGYFPLYRFDPRLEAEGKNPFQLDYKTPDFSKFRDFVLTETRYNQLPIVNPAEAEMLLDKSRMHAERRFARLAKMSDIKE